MVFFLAVSESIDCGRYPVRVFELDAQDVDAGHALFRRDLNTYHECRINDEWGGVEIIKRPGGHANRICTYEQRHRKHQRTSRHSNRWNCCNYFQPRRLEPTDEIRRGNGAKPRNGTGAPRRKPADCMAVAMQAAQWGMNPFAVAQKTHVVNGTLGYEAQLVNAVISTMSPTKDRINYEWFAVGTRDR